MLSPNAIKNLVILGAVVSLVLGSYYKGHHDASVAYELENKQAQIDMANKIDRVETISASVAQTLQVATETTNNKLETILLASRGKKLTSVPCTPSVDFSTTWNEFNKATK